MVVMMVITVVKEIMTIILTMALKSDIQEILRTLFETDF